MNYKELQKHIVANQFVDVQILKSDGSNANDFFTTDVVGDKSFAQNFGGYPRSDIAMINEQQNIAVQKALLDKLETITPDNSNAGLSDVEIALGHRSKYQQAPSEMQSWLSDQLAIRDAKRLEYARQMAAKAAEQQKSSVVKKHVVQSSE